MGTSAGPRRSPDRRLARGDLAGGRTVTDSDDRYEFVTIKPGPYPWGNHYNAWRPAHVHFSLLGRCFEQRLVTQMYLLGDPLFPHDPIFNSVRDERKRERMISRFSMENSQDNWALAYEFDIVLGAAVRRRSRHRTDAG